MTIVNPNPRPTLHEYPRHFKSKVRVGRLADRYFAVRWSMEIGTVLTLFEYPYPPIITARGPRMFTADIAIGLREKNWYPVHEIDIEIDDHKHNEKKDDFRDDTLLYDGIKVEGSYKKNGLSCSEPYKLLMHVPTLRLPGDLRGISDAILEEELDQFCARFKIIPLDQQVI